MPRAWKTPTKTSHLIVALSVVAAGAVVAGCGSGGSSSSANTIPRAPAAARSTNGTAAGAPDERASVAAALACVRQHGANLPDPQIDANGQVHFDQAATAAIPQSALQAAEQSCSDLIAKALATVPKDPNLVGDRLKFAQCMRQHGVTDSPDPDPTTGRFNLNGPAIDKNSPQVAAAEQACQGLLPN
ncbi:MAG: hypothetical protein JOZ04_00335, partial [Acidimicrobiia bacterium]|nr:hypothetical protein [Acidimicrobiia bacterium]